MILIDVHNHLNHRMFSKDIDSVIEKCRAANVKKIIVNGVNDKTNRECLEMSERYDIVECAFGAYPVDALNIVKNYESGLTQSAFNLEKEFDFWRKNKEKFVAIGEVGLDYQEAGDRKEEQKKNFVKIIAIAKELDKPLIVHTRKAEADCVEMLIASGFPGRKIVLHCFGGKKSLIKRAAEYGMNFSIPPIIGRLEHFKCLVENVNVTQLLTETDAPWLGPERDQRNDPSNVIFAIREIARIKGFTEEEVANTIFMTYQQVFG